MNRIQGLNGLQFHNKPAINQKIEPMFSDLLGFIGNLYRFLALMSNFKARKLDAKSLFVKLLKKTRPQGFMDFDRSPDDSGAKIRIFYCTQIPEFLSSRLMN
jgi:hypothetical protein